MRAKLLDSFSLDKIFAASNVLPLTYQQKSHFLSGSPDREALLDYAPYHTTSALCKVAERVDPEQDLASTQVLLSLIKEYLPMSEGSLLPELFKSSIFVRLLGRCFLLEET